MFYLFLTNLILATYLGRRMDQRFYGLPVGGVTLVFFFISLPPAVHFMPGFETLKPDPSLLAGLVYIVMTYVLMAFFYAFFKLPLPVFLNLSEKNRPISAAGNRVERFNLTPFWYIAGGYIIFSVCVDLFAVYAMGFKDFATFTPIDYGGVGSPGGGRSLLGYFSYLSGSLTPPLIIMVLAALFHSKRVRARIMPLGRIFLWTAVLLAVLGNFVGGSRGLVLAVLLGGTIVFLWNLDRNRFSARLVFRYFLVAAAAAFALIFTTLIRHNHFSQVNNSQVDASQYRLNIAWIPDDFREAEFFVAMFSHYISNSYSNYGVIYENRDSFEPTYGFSTIRGSGIIYRMLSGRFYRDINVAKWNNKETEAQLGMLNQWRGWFGAYMTDTLFFLPFQFVLLAFIVVYIPRVIRARSLCLFYIYYPSTAIFGWSTLVAPITSFPFFFGPFVFGLAFLALKPSWFLKVTGQEVTRAEPIHPARRPLPKPV